MPSKKPWVANEQLSIDIFFSSSTKSKSASASGRKNSATKRKQRTTTNLDPDAICNDVDLDPVGPSAKRVNTVLDDEQDFPLNFASRASSSKVKPSYGLATPAPAQTTREVFPTTQHTSSRRKAQARRISVQNTLQTPITRLTNKTKNVHGLFTPAIDALTVKTKSSVRAVVTISSDESDPVVHDTVTTASTSTHTIPKKPHLQSRTIPHTPPATLLRPTRSSNRMAPPPAPLRIIVPDDTPRMKTGGILSSSPLSPLSSPTLGLNDTKQEDQQNPVSLFTSVEKCDPTGSTPKKEEKENLDIGKTQKSLPTPRTSHRSREFDEFPALSQVSTSPAPSSPIKSRSTLLLDSNDASLWDSQWEVPSSQSQYIPFYKSLQQQNSSPITIRRSGFRRPLGNNDDAAIEVPSSQSQYLGLCDSTIIHEPAPKQECFSTEMRSGEVKTTRFSDIDMVPCSQGEYDELLMSRTPKRSQHTSRPTSLSPVRAVEPSSLDYVPMGPPTLPPTPSLPSVTPIPNAHPPSSMSCTQMSATQTDSQYSQLARSAVTVSWRRDTTMKESCTQVSMTQTDSQYSLLGQSVPTSSQLSCTQTDSQCSQFVKDATRRIGVGTDTPENDKGPKMRYRGRIDLFKVRERVNSTPFPEWDEEDINHRAGRLYQTDVDNDSTRFGFEFARSPDAPPPSNSVSSSLSQTPSSTAPTPEYTSRPASPPPISQNDSETQTQFPIPAFVSQDDFLELTMAGTESDRSVELPLCSPNMGTDRGIVTPRRLRRMVKAFRDGRDPSARVDSEEVKQFLEMLDEDSGEE